MIMSIRSQELSKLRMPESQYFEGDVFHFKFGESNLEITYIIQWMISNPTWDDLDFDPWVHDEFEGKDMQKKMWSDLEDGFCLSGRMLLVTC